MHAKFLFLDKTKHFLEAEQCTTAYFSLAIWFLKNKVSSPPKTKVSMFIVMDQILFYMHHFLFPISNVSKGSIAIVTKPIILNDLKRQEQLEN